MHRITTLLLLASSFAFAQVDFRKLDVDATQQSGALLMAAEGVNDPAQAISMLDEFFAKHGDTSYRPQALYLMLKAAGDTQQGDKALKAGKELLLWFPNDLELLHRVNVALVQMERWDEFDVAVERTRTLAKAAAQQTGDAGHFGMGVIDWLAWAENAAMKSAIDPAKKLAWLDRIRENYPEGTYARNAADYYIPIYREAGDTENMVLWMRKAIEAGSEDARYRYALAEYEFSIQNGLEAEAYARNTLELIKRQEKPADVATETAWRDEKLRIYAEAHFIIGRLLAMQSKPETLQEAQTHLLEAVNLISQEGGERYNVLAYLLGVCHGARTDSQYSLEQATLWMNEASRAEGPHQVQAREYLNRHRSAL